MEFTPGKCTFAIKAADDYADVRLPYGFHVEGEDRCPVNHPPALAELAQPNGTEECILFNAVICGLAFAEELRCPVRMGKRAKSTNSKI